MEKYERVKTPLLLQMEANECGAASLGIILGYYGKFLPLEELRQVCNITRDGSNAGNIILAGESLGMKGLGYTYTPEEAVRIKPPAVFHWGFAHFLVFEGYDEEKNIVYINDPAQGHCKVPWEEFETMFTGIALVLRPDEGFEKSGKPQRVWGDLFQELFAYKSALFFALGIGVSLAIVNIYEPAASQIFFDSVLSFKQRGWLFDVLLAMTVIFFIKLVMELVRGWCMVRWQGALTVGNSAGFLNHVLHLPVDFFKQRYAAEIASRVQFNESVAGFVTGSLASVVLDAGMAVFYLLLLLLYDVRLTILGVLFTVINCAITWLVLGWFREKQVVIQQSMGNMYGLSAAGIAAMETLKANGNEADFFVKWANANAKYLTQVQERELMSHVLDCLPALLSAINASLVMLIGGLEIMDGVMTVGVFVAFQQFMRNFQEPVQRLVNISQSIQETESQLMKLRDVENYPTEPERQRSGEVPVRLKGELELVKVSFNYGRIGRPLIKRLNLHIPPGHRVAVVGASGSGKSTVSRLAAGLYKPWSGEILFDGIPFERITPAVFANSVAVVEQEVLMFAGTVAENISLFDNQVLREDIIRAARDAEIHDDILNLNGGYDARIIEGGMNLSGGQCQRLELARALVRRPSLLILDEATSAIDPVTEKKIMRNIRRRGCSCLIIAHRLSTVRDCDEIIVLENGRVIERGNHEQLAAAHGAYCRLMAGGEQGGERNGSQGK